VIGFSENSELLCPRCGNEYLHHGEVAVYDRREDAPEVERFGVVPVTDPDFPIFPIIGSSRATYDVLPDAESRNPSSRRNGVTIAFSCEGCHAVSVLQIAQHKGVSEFSWAGASK
jgi:hypothetical protein